MIQEIGFVEGLKGEYAFVRANRTASCERCASKGMCNIVEDTGHVIVQALNTVGAKEGDTVRIELPEKSFLAASALIYLFPIIALIIGGFIGGLLHPHFSESITKDGLSALTAFAFLIISVIIVKIVGKNIGKGLEYTPKIVEIIE